MNYGWCLRKNYYSMLSYQMPYPLQRGITCLDWWAWKPESQARGKWLVAINSMFMDYGWHSKTVTLERINKELILKENKKNEAL